MLLGETYLIKPLPEPTKTFIEEVQELCEETEPKPLYCELPDELKLRFMEASGTVQTYSYTTSMASGSSGYGTSTTTTI